MIAAIIALVGAQHRCSPCSIAHVRPSSPAVSTPSRRVSLDALPDLSDTQVIVYTEMPGQAPQVVEDQVTYPAHHGDAERAALGRGARLLLLRRVLRLRHLRGRHRHLLGAQPRAGIPQRRRATPAGRRARPTLGPDATGVGWVYQYAWSAPNRSLAELRSLQDWYSALRRRQGRQRRRGGERRRLRASSIRRGRRSRRTAALPRAPARCRARGGARQQYGCRRTHGRAGRDRVHDPRPRLSQGHRRSRTHRAQGRWRRRRAAARRGAHRAGARRASRHRRARRQGRGGERHRPAASRRRTRST
jgi:hypothetical protein